VLAAAHIQLIRVALEFQVRVITVVRVEMEPLFGKAAVEVVLALLE
jgi:hypothetical protein